jgi:hypothetical protein
MAVAPVVRATTAFLLARFLEAFSTRSRASSVFSLPAFSKYLIRFIVNSPDVLEMT